MKLADWIHKNISGLLLVVVMSPLCAGGGVALSYSVTDLGVLSDLPGQNKSTINAINNAGMVVGVNLTNGFYRGFVYSSNIWMEIGTLGGTNSAALGLNDSGLAAGRALLTNGFNRGFLWTLGGSNGVVTNPQMQDLGTVGSIGIQSQTDDINSFSQLCGYSRDTNNVDHAIRYTGGVMADIHTSGVGLPNSYGFSINDSSHIAGTAYNKSFSSWSVFYHNGTTATNLGNFGQTNLSKSFGWAINDADSIVGYLTDTNGHSHAFIWSGGAVTDLGTLGGHFSYALAVNSNNDAVGYSSVNLADTTYHAFVRNYGAMRDLNILLDSTGTGWFLTEARGINDLGQIVGIGSLSGIKHGFLLNPTIFQTPDITGFKLQATDAIFSFEAVSNQTYFVQYKSNLAEPTWNYLMSNIVADGSMVTLTNLGSGPSRYYRVGYHVP